MVNCSLTITVFLCGSLCLHQSQMQCLLDPFNRSSKCISWTCIINYPLAWLSCSPSCFFCFLLLLSLFPFFPSFLLLFCSPFHLLCLVCLCLLCIMFVSVLIFFLFLSWVTSLDNRSFLFSSVLHMFAFIHVRFNMLFL